MTETPDREGGRELSTPKRVLLGAWLLILAVVLEFELRSEAVGLAGAGLPSACRRSDCACGTMTSDRYRRPHVALQWRCSWRGIGSTIVLVVLAPQVQAQDTPYTIVGDAVGYLQSQYGGTCADDQSPLVGLYGGVGLKRSKMSVEVSYRRNQNVGGVSCALGVLVREDGVHEVSRFDRDAGKGLNALIAEAPRAQMSKQSWLA